MIIARYGRRKGALVHPYNLGARTRSENSSALLRRTSHSIARTLALISLFFAALVPYQDLSLLSIPQTKALAHYY